MKCIIEGNGVKVFGRAVHALSRIGDEIWLDPLQKGLAVRSVNTAHSAYACFFFSPLFFQHYTPNLDDLKERKAAKCKVSLKSVLPLFRSVATIERNVYRCEISILDSRVRFQFNCRHGITKTHNLGFQECDALQAVFSAHLCPNILRSHPKLLSDIVMHFPISQEEITLSVSPIRVKLKSYYEEENDHTRNMYTEMSVHPDEFDYFQVGVDSDVTFCLKELRKLRRASGIPLQRQYLSHVFGLAVQGSISAVFVSVAEAAGQMAATLAGHLTVTGLLSFAESHGLPVSAHFSASGKPVSFSVEDMVLEAVVVLATVVSPSSENPSQEAPVPRNMSRVCPATTPIADIAHMSMHEGPLEAEVAGVAPEHSALPPGEQVASSQGSPVFCPDIHMRKLLQLQREETYLSRPKVQSGVITGSTLTTPVTPATFKIRSLLFGAVSSNQPDGNTSELPSLACASDTEDDAGDDGVRVEE